MSKTYVRCITAGAGELDIAMSVFRHGDIHWKPHFTFEGLGKVSVHVESVSGKEQREDSVMITGFVFLNDHNRQQYHYFTATYNVWTRTGQATFEVNCRDCGAEVNEYGFCPTCEEQIQERIRKYEERQQQLSPTQ